MSSLSLDFDDLVDFVSLSFDLDFDDLASFSIDLEDLPSLSFDLEDLPSLSFDLDDLVSLSLDLDDLVSLSLDLELSSNRSKSDPSSSCNFLTIDSFSFFLSFSLRLYFLLNKELLAETRFRVLDFRSS